MPHEIQKANAIQGIAIVAAPYDVEEASQPFGKRYRDQVVTLRAEHLHALQDGQCIAVDVQEEYVIFLRLEEPVAEGENLTAVIREKVGRLGNVE